MHNLVSAATPQCNLRKSMNEHQSFWFLLNLYWISSIKRVKLTTFKLKKYYFFHFKPNSFLELIISMNFRLQKKRWAWALNFFWAKSAKLFFEFSKLNFYWLCWITLLLNQFLQDWLYNKHLIIQKRMTMHFLDQRALNTQVSCNTIPLYTKMTNPF